MFTDPTARVKTGYVQSRQPLPIDLEIVRAALHSTNPAQAALVALAAFHGLGAAAAAPYGRGRWPTARPRACHRAGRPSPRLAAWPAHRTSRWPNTTSPYLFISQRTATLIQPVGERWLRLTIGPGLTPTALREDRILNEATPPAGMRGG